MKGYKGKIAFYKKIEFDYYAAVMLDDRDPLEVFDDDYLFLGVTVDVDVEFKDTRKEEVEAIELEIQKTRAELEFRINTLIGRKNEILAIESAGDL